MNEFLTNSFPEVVESFMLDDSDPLRNKPFGFYAEKILRILPSIMKSLYLGGFFIKKHHFENLIQGSKDLE